MKKYHILQPQNIRNINGSFAWIDRRLIRNGFLDRMPHEDILLYLFLALVADKKGVSFYRKEKICEYEQIHIKPAKMFLRLLVKSIL